MFKLLIVIFSVICCFIFFLLEFSFGLVYSLCFGLKGLSQIFFVLVFQNTHYTQCRLVCCFCRG